MTKEGKNLDSSKKEPTTREQFFSRAIIKEQVRVPELNLTVYEKVMSGPERRQFQELFNSEEKDADGNPLKMVPTLIGLCTIGEDEKHLFTLDDIDRIDRLPTTITDPLFKCAARINGLTQKALDDRVKN